MPELIDEITTEEIECPSCNKLAEVSRFTLRYTRPFKSYVATRCTECGYNDSSATDCDHLDFGVRITCDFKPSSALSENPTGGNNEHMRRMVFVNSDAVVSIIYKDQLLMEFTCEAAHIDCIEGILMRGLEILSCAKDDNASDCQITISRRCLSDILNGAAFKLIINDNSGFSKVCPLGKEYTEIQNNDILELNEAGITYEKLAKK